jgi:hypothetical protein
MRPRHGGVSDRDFVGVVATAADEGFLGLEGAHAMRVHPRDELFHLGHHFGADAVTGKQKKIVGRHECTPRHH